MHAAASYNDLSDAQIHHDVPGASSPREPGCLFSFGVIADVQHADIDDGASFKGVPRYYRGALDVLDRAVDAWAAQKVDFAVHLGDIVDGYNPKDQSESALRSVLDRFDRLGRPTYHMLGNHCLYNLPRARLNEALGIEPLLPGPESLDEGDRGSFYSFSPHPGFRLVVLDAYAVSVLGWPEGDARRELAKRLLHENNPNAREGNPNSPEGLEGVARRFVQFGGGLGAAQLAWLDEELSEAASRGERAILASHLPVHPDSAFPTCLLWDYEECLAVIAKHPGTVALTLSGHMHRDGDSVGADGTHHRCVYGVIETPPGEDCHAVVEVHADHIDIRGHGRVANQRIPLVTPRGSHGAVVPGS